MPGWPRFRPIADHGLLVEFGDTIGDAAHTAVVSLDYALTRHRFTGFVEAVPANVNLLVAFDPLITDHSAVQEAVTRILARPQQQPPPGALHLVQICYDDDLAPDLAAVAAQKGLTPDAVIAAHLAGRYHVAMYGFAPGYAYLTGVPEVLYLPRKPAALRRIDAGCVVIAGWQCIVTTLAMPNGWWILGRSPTRIMTGDDQRPFLFAVGDRVQFCRIDRATYEKAR